MGGGGGHLTLFLSVHISCTVKKTFLSYSGPRLGHLCHTDTFLVLYLNQNIYCGSQKNGLNEKVFLSTQNKC